MADVLVTGAAGFIGRALVRRLESKGIDVVGTDVSPPAPVRLDVTDDNEVRRVLTEHQPSVVIHAAALVDDRGDPSAFWKVNVESTKTLFEACAAAKVGRFVHISSIAALGTDPGPVGDEQTPLLLAAGNPYFDTKAASEQWVRARSIQRGLPLVVVRPGDVYGHDSSVWVDRPVQLMRQGVPVLVDGGAGYIAHVHVENLVDGIELAIEHPDAVGQVLTFTDDERTTYGHYFERLRLAASVDRPLRSMSRRVALTMAGAMDAIGRLSRRPMPMTRSAVHYICRRTHYPIEQARRLGYAPRKNLDEGMNELAASFGSGPR